MVLLEFVQGQVGWFSYVILYGAEEEICRHRHRPMTATERKALRPKLAGSCLRPQSTLTWPSGRSTPVTKITEAVVHSRMRLAPLRST